MKIINKILVQGFYLANLVLIMLYLYPGSIFGYLLYNDSSLQPQITRDFIISSNHFYAFVFLSILGVSAYQNTKKIKFIIIYLFLLSIILELLHIFIPIRTFEWTDLFGNFLGVILIIIIYKIKNRYA
jgi:VanZ family protein